MYKMVAISAETWNNSEVSVLRIHESDNVDNWAARMFMTWFIKKLTGNTMLKKKWMNPQDSKLEGTK